MGGGVQKMKWDDKKLIDYCSRCHYRDSDPRLCHAVEPPMDKINKEYIGEYCPFIPDTYWDRIPKERKERFEKDVINRSKRFYKNKEEA